MTLNEWIEELIAFRDRECCGELDVKKVVVIDGMDDIAEVKDPPKPWIAQLERSGDFPGTKRTVVV